MSAGEGRLDSIIHAELPYVGSCGALDMVNFGAKDTVPEKYRGRTLYVHNPQVTLMRTTPDENRVIGEWIGRKLNECKGQVRFLLPEKGVSALDAPGKAFYDPEADDALFGALTKTVKHTDKRKLLSLPYHINAPEFADSVVASFRDIVE